MSTETKEILAEVVGEVFEAMAFMFADPLNADSTDEVELDQPIEVHLEFVGAATGEVAIVVPEGMCQELAANILGVEPDDEDAVAKALDSLKEILNVICGNALTRVAGEEPVFNLNIPKTGELTEETLADWLHDEDTVFLMVDDFTLLARFKCPDLC